MAGPVDVVEERARSRVGSTLRNKYTLEALLGLGGTAAVYRGVHRNGYRVAIKMLHREISLDRDIRSRFLSEGYAANKVGHEGVMRVLDDDTAEDGSTFLVMELLDGETLDERAGNNRGRLPVKDVLAAAYQLLDVLAVAHARGIIHRDVKPENLFLTHGGILEILDFGIARVRDLAAAHATANGQVFGTPAFMPPEQALGQPADVDHRSDLWAVGATMFTLLTGRYVYEGESAIQHIAQAAHASPPLLQSALPGVSSHVAAIVDRALLREREHRWQSAREMQQAVDEAHASVFGMRLSSDTPMLQTPAASVLGEVPTLPPAPAVTTRHVSVGLGLAIGVGALATGAGVSVLWWWLARAPEMSPLPVVRDPPAAASTLPPFDRSGAHAPAGTSSTAKTAAPSASPSSKTPRRLPPKRLGTGAFDYQ
jgi:serine/threonine-protein kinase